MNLNPDVWGPHYWFFLHTISLNYPKYPNAVTKKKYYDFISNLPLFIPVESMATKFSKLLDKYPVAPYLDSKESFVKWMHFIHNKINEQLEKPKISLDDFYVFYYEQYKKPQTIQFESSRWKEKLIYIIVFLSFVFLAVYLIKL
jgi:hypothetical protein